jgi:hypothetical protein
MRLLLIFVFRLTLLAAFTFGFVVLFEHGPAKFSEGARTEWNAFLFFAGSLLSKQEGAPARAAAQPAAMPAPSPTTANSPPQKAAPTGSGTNQPATGTPARNR